MLTTHDMDEADRLCDRIAVLDRGRAIALDSPANLKFGARLVRGSVYASDKRGR